MNRYIVATLPGLLSVFVAPLQAEEIKVSFDDRAGLFLNVYQQNMALVQSQYKIKLPDGISSVAFEGVSDKIQPQTTLIDGKNVTVLEKNYVYNLLNRENLLDAYVGKEVKAVTIDHETSKNLFDKAVLLNNDFGYPMLQFDYGIDPHFPGRIVFPDVPKNLRLQPTLIAKMASKGNDSKDISLSYLSGGLSWTGNYVAEITDKNKMNLQSWVEIDNKSATDFTMANISLVSGDINNISSDASPRPLMMAALRQADTVNMAETEAVSEEIAAQSMGDYYSYEIPGKVDLLAKQSKQISLWYEQGVGYEKQYKFLSPLNNYSKIFERLHANVVYRIVNNTKQKLGRPMPEGIVRFYEKEKNGTLSFMGAAQMPRLAVDESADLIIGKSYDVYADGKIINLNQIVENVTEVEYEIQLYNAGKSDVYVIWEQKIPNDTTVLKESLDSESVSAGKLRWKINVAAGGKNTLTYKLRQTRN